MTARGLMVSVTSLLTSSSRKIMPVCLQLPFTAAITSRVPTPELCCPGGRTFDYWVADYWVAVTVFIRFAVAPVHC